MFSEYHNPPFLTNAVATFINKTFAKANPFHKLVAINFEAYREILEAVLEKYRKDKKRKGAKSGRPGFDIVFMLKVIFASIILGLPDLMMYGKIYSDYQLREFLGFPKRIPKPSTIWNWREIFTNYRVFEMIFHYDVERLKALFPHIGRDILIVDSSFVPVPRQRNSRNENLKIKLGEGDKLWCDQPAKKRQKDIHARWTKKRDETFYAYKGHFLSCGTSMFILDIHVTAANCHDAKAARELFKLIADRFGKKGAGLFADSAYDAKALRKQVEEYGLIPYFVKKSRRNVKLTANEKAHNRDISSIRTYIEHIFGYICKVFKAGLSLRSIGKKRADAGIFAIGWAYNLHRVASLGY